MMLRRLREEVFEANLEIVRRGLVLYTFGNASGIERQRGLVVIKPSGVDYRRLKPGDLVVTDLKGKVVEGKLRPSSDLPTHLCLYRAFSGIGGIVHTHSTHAAAWAQSGREIPCLGTTHADYFRGAIPATAPLEKAEIDKDYEWNTGEAIVRRFAGLDPMEMPAVLVAGHAPFCWARTPAEAAELAVILEEVARLAWKSVTVNPAVQPIRDALRDKHFLRKHGSAASYGQPRKK